MANPTNYHQLVGIKWGYIIHRYDHCIFVKMSMPEKENSHWKCSQPFWALQIHALCLSQLKDTRHKQRVSSHVAVQGSILGGNYLHLIELLLLVVCHLSRKNKEEKRLLLITERHTESSAFTVDKMLHRQNCFGLCRRLVCYTLRLCQGRCALDIILKPISGGPISCIKPVQPSRRLGPMHLEV